MVVSRVAVQQVPLLQSQPSPPASQPAVLVPACDPALDRSSLDHLLLNPKQDFHYSQQGIGSGSGTVATVKVPQPVDPAVQLQVSSAIQRVTCTSNSAQIQFGNQAAYDAALANWIKVGAFILVAYSEGCCSGHAAGKQDYLVVTSVTGDGSNTITAVIRVTNFESAVGRETVATVDIGIFNPTNGTDGFTVIPGAGNNTTNGTTGGNPPPAPTPAPSALPTPDLPGVEPPPVDGAAPPPPLAPPPPPCHVNFPVPARVALWLRQLR